ncbi:MAG TPA: DUF4157 domain-containing protein [Kofleriaceae bacterium]|nr:DUF4157 domain-containing protein [Kofleriaceae bacterium]
MGGSGSTRDSSSVSPGKSTLTMQLPQHGVAQRKSGGTATPAARERPAGGSGGGAMPEAVQAKMESAFGADFSSVRVHEGEQAGQLGALAYTQGADIHFAPGQYQPDSHSGQELLGHELAHVVQQSQGRVASGAPLAKGLTVNSDPALEQEADQMGARAAAGMPVGDSQMRAPVQASASAPVQMVAVADASKIMTQLRKQKAGYPALASYALPKDSKENREQLFQELTALAQEKSADLSAMSPEEAAKLYLEHKASQMGPVQETAPATPLELEEPFPLLGADKQAIPGQSIDFVIPNLGRGRIALYQGVGEPSYRETLTWMSHGIQASDGTKPAKDVRSFGFVVDDNTKMIRPESVEKTTGLIDSFESSGIPQTDTVPDMLVGAHNRTEFNPNMLQAGGAALAKCHVAILCDFIPVSSSEVDPSFQTPGMKHLGYTYPPLADIVNNVPQLGAYKKWLMLCCRSRMENILANKDRPEAHPETVRPFNDSGNA